MSDLTGLDSILQRSILNRQKKNKYSFGKSQRFPHLKSTYTIDFYEKPILKNTRTCSFGYGSKFDFSKVPSNPSASQYHINQAKIGGISFGIGREQIKSGDYLRNNLTNSPSSTKYNPKIDFSARHKRSPFISLVPKRSQDSFIKKTNNPEPTKYDQSLERQGRVSLSKFVSPPKSSFPKSERFLHQLENSLIGPSSYQVKDHYDSKRKLPKNNVFGVAPKKTYLNEAIKRSSSPGPIYYIP